MSIKEDLEFVEGFIEGYDHLGTGSNSKAAEKEAKELTLAWQRVKASATVDLGKEYNIGELTMSQVFAASALTNLSDLQAVFDAVETALVRFKRF